MAESEVAIVNSALIKIGESPIVSLTQDTEAARVANRQYPIKRDELLRSYRWNFAIKRATLALDSVAPAFGFTHQFVLPDDNIRVIGIYDDTQPLQNYTSSRIQWKMESVEISGANQLRLLTTDSVSQVFYLAQITDVGLFDAQFAEALSLSLAVDLAYFLSTGDSRLAGIEARFTEVIRQAKLSDAIEGKPEVIEASDWVDSRYTDPLINSRIGPVIS